jgi:hypothetical protein
MKQRQMDFMLEDKLELLLGFVRAIRDDEVSDWAEKNDLPSFLQWRHSASTSENVYLTYEEDMAQAVLEKLGFRN